MMDDPNQGAYTFTGAQLKEQRRQWMDEGRRSALAEQALIEKAPGYEVGSVFLGWHRIEDNKPGVVAERFTEGWYMTNGTLVHDLDDLTNAVRAYSIIPPFPPGPTAIKPPLREGIDFNL